jgi:DNA-binding XRE family transcriptional regulator
MSRKTTSVKHMVTTVDEFFDQLNAYFDSGEGRSVAEIALDAGITRQHLYDIKKRASMPSFELVVKLTALIGGTINFSFPKNLCQV